MAKRHSTPTRGTVAAVGYIRRSTSKQEKSLDDQQREIERYAGKHGYRIVRWYKDDGVSGDATERRQGFQQLHHDACNGRDFDAILCWDFSRFGRFDSIEAGRWIDPLRKAGVQLVTLDKGLINWNDFGGRLINAIEAEGKHAYLVDHSRNVARGQIRKAAEGRTCGQRPPYGYDRLLVDETGKVRQRLERCEKYAKPRSWSVVWAPAEDPQQVRTVRWLFDTYATTDIGYRALAAQLNQQGVPSPTGGKWHDSTIRALLTNQAYIGTFVWNKRRHGKYHRIVDGDIVERDRGEVHLMPCGKPNARFNPRELWTVVENAHPPLIERETFDKVQAKVARRKRSSGCSYQTCTSRKDRPEYLLTGLLYCSHCGRKMHGALYRRNKGGKTYTYQRYVCSSYTRGDRTCGHHAIRQDQIFAAIVDKIRQDLLQGGLERLKQSLRRKLRQRQQPDTAQQKRLQRRIGELDKQIDTAAERVLTAPEDLLELLSRKLQQMKRERELLAQDLKRMQPVKQRGVQQQVDQLAGKAWALLDELRQAEPARVRELLHCAIDRVELSFTTRQQGKKRQYHPTGGRVVFRELSSFASRGDWI